MNRIRSVSSAAGVVDPRLPAGFPLLNRVRPSGLLEGDVFYLKSAQFLVGDCNLADITDALEVLSEDWSMIPKFSLPSLRGKVFLFVCFFLVRV